MRISDWSSDVCSSDLGYRKIVEPGTIISVMLVLEDGQIAFGDCADVIFAGVAGRDRVFQAEEHIDLLRTQVADRLRGRDRSEERRVGKEGVSTGSSRWSQ